MVEIGKYVYPELSGEKREGLSDTKNNAHSMTKHRKRFANRCRWGVLAALVVLGFAGECPMESGRDGRRYPQLLGDDFRLFLRPHLSCGGRIHGGSRRATGVHQLAGGGWGIGIPAEKLRHPPFPVLQTAL